VSDTLGTEGRAKAAEAGTLERGGTSVAAGSPQLDGLNRAEDKARSKRERSRLDLLSPQTGALEDYPPSLCTEAVENAVAQIAMYSVVASPGVL